MFVSKKISSRCRHAATAMQTGACSQGLHILLFTKTTEFVSDKSSKTRNRRTCLRFGAPLYIKFTGLFFKLYFKTFNVPQFDN